MEKEKAEAARIKRKVEEIDSSGQLGLFEGKRKGLKAERRGERKSRSASFRKPSAKGLLIGDEPLEGMLDRMGDRSIQLRALLEEMDWKEFEERYTEQGRPAYHPLCMVGLILYGIGEGKSSLRELETLAKKDIGCFYVTGGIFPDHSVIGRFIQTHEETLTEKFFQQLTRQILKKTGSRSEVGSADGTTVAAAASNYRRLKREVAEQQAREAAEELEKAPEDKKLQKRAEKAEKAAEAAREREQQRRDNRKPVDTVRVSGSEPEAVLQPLKNKRKTFAYKPSIVANEDRIILGQTVHPSSETEILPEMLAQAKEVAPELECLLMDAGYFQAKVFRECKSQKIEEVFCPEGREEEEEEDSIRLRNGLFHKSVFQYDAEKDCYVCPAGQQLTPCGSGNDRGLSYVRYGNAPCVSCSLLTSCTRSQHKMRTIKRYEGDELKEAMRETFSKPENRLRYRRRKVMVEPVFSELKLKQGFARFKRFGLQKVRVECALHALAHNFRRYCALTGADSALFGPHSTISGLLRRLTSPLRRKIGQLFLFLQSSRFQPSPTQTC